MNIKETSAPESGTEKISNKETDKIKEVVNAVKLEDAEISANSANQKLMQRLNNQKEIETNSPEFNADDKINNGEKVEYGMMYCSDRCIKSKVSSGRCFHS